MCDVTERGCAATCFDTGAYAVVGNAAHAASNPAGTTHNWKRVEMPTRTVDSANGSLAPFKGRDPYSAATVFVYWNRHVKRWSVMAQDGPHAGQIVGHATHLVLDFARWRVNHVGRQRVIDTGVRNVHAGVFGTLAEVEPEGVVWEQVSYNPFRDNNFHLADLPGSVVSSTRYAMFDMAGNAWAA